MDLLNFILQAQTPAAPSMGKQMIPLLLVVVVFYFFMIRPQVKKQKELKNYRTSIQKGEKIVTTGGIYGKVTDVKEQTVTVEIADNVRIKIDKNAVLKDPEDVASQAK